MVFALEIDESSAVVLPKGLLDRLNVGIGDMLYAVELENGVRLTSGDPNLLAEMEIAERVMADDRDILKKLAE